MLSVAFAILLSASAAPVHDDKNNAIAHDTHYSVKAIWKAGRKNLRARWPRQLKNGDVKQVKAQAEVEAAHAHLPPCGGTCRHAEDGGSRESTPKGRMAPFAKRQKVLPQKGERALEKKKERSQRSLSLSLSLWPAR